METRILIFEGYLRKSPPEKKMATDKWRIRKFKLWNNKELEYFRKDTETKPLRKPINLSECLEVTDAKKDQSKYYKNEYKWAFCLQMPERLYYLIAPSDEERKTWKEKICELCSLDMQVTKPEYTISMPMNNSRHSPYSSSNSSHTEEQRSGSDSSVNRFTPPVSIHNSSERSSTISDIASLESEHSYDELPPPRLANNLSISFGSYDNNIITGIPTLGKSYKETYKTSQTSHDSTSTNQSFDLYTKSTNRSLTHMDSEVFNCVYDVPPSSKNRRKQLSTKSSITITNELGYVKMDPSVTEFDDQGEDYIEMQAEQYIEMQSAEYIAMHGEEYITMGASSPNEVMGRGSVKEFKSIGDTLNRLPSVQINYNNVQTSSPRYTGRLPTSIGEEMVFDEIPEIIGNKWSKETALEPPAVNRKAKPRPTIDRTTKPKVGTPEETYINSSEIPSNGTGYFTFSRHNSDEYQSIFTDTSLTSDDYVNEKIIYDLNNNTRYNKKQNIGPASNENQHKHRPYSNDICNDGELTLDRTDYYRDTNNNHHKEDEYLQKDLPSLPTYNEHENKFVVKDLPALPNTFVTEDTEDIYMKPSNVPKSDDCYENVDISLQDNNIDKEYNDSMYENEDCYENVRDINQKYHETAEGLRYIQCSPKLKKDNNTINQFELPPATTGAGYIKIDPIKSAAAKDLR